MAILANCSPASMPMLSRNCSAITSPAFFFSNSPMQTIGMRPASSAARIFFDTLSFVSPKYLRRGCGPRSHANRPMPESSDPKSLRCRLLLLPSAGSERQSVSWSRGWRRQLFRAQKRWTDHDLAVYRRFDQWHESFEEDRSRGCVLMHLPIRYKQRRVNPHQTLTTGQTESRMSP